MQPPRRLQRQRQPPRDRITQVPVDKDRDLCRAPKRDRGCVLVVATAHEASVCRLPKALKGRDDRYQEVDSASLQPPDKCLCVGYSPSAGS